MYNFNVTLGLAAVVLAPFGFPDRAVTYVEEGLALMQPHDQNFIFTSALGLLATAHERRGEWHKALQYGKRMIEVSQARALASLCRLHQAQRHDEGCRQQLAELYGWFSEGFETEDLRFVRTVLEEVM